MKDHKFYHIKAEWRVRNIQKEAVHSRFGADGNPRSRIFYRLPPQPNDFCQKNGSRWHESERAFSDCLDGHNVAEDKKAGSWGLQGR